MIGKIVQGKGFRGAVSYVLEKKDSRLLYAEGVRLRDVASIAQSFITQSKLKPNVLKPVAHISLDFSARDKVWLKDDLMVNIAREYMRKMGYENTQYIIARHHDTEHPHVHLIINRIDDNGNRISDQNERFRNTKICLELTQKYGLHIAAGKENVNEHRLKGADKVKYEIYHALKLTLPNCGNWNELKAELSKFGVSLELRKNGSTNKIQGVRFGKDDFEFNGSKIDRAFSYSKITEQLQQNERLIMNQSIRSNHHSSSHIFSSSSSFETAPSTLGKLLNILKIPVGGNGNDNSESLREEARKRKKQKKGRSL